MKMTPLINSRNIHIQPFFLSNMGISNIFRRKIKKWDRRVHISKRQQFIIATSILTFGMMITQLVPSDTRYQMIAGLSVSAYFISAIVLRDELKGIKWLTLLTLPALFTAAIGVFYFLLPVRWLTRIPFVMLYAVSMYALFLTENIYNVAAYRTIALLRAAHTVGFLFTLISFFFLAQTIFSIRNNYLFNSVSVGLICFLLLVQLLWSVLLENRISKIILVLSLCLALFMMEVTCVLSFLPVNMTIAPLFLTTCFYAVSGMAQSYLMEKLYKKTISEFFVVVVVVFIILVFSTHFRNLYY